MEERLAALLGYYDRPIDTDRLGHREVTFLTRTYELGEVKRVVVGKRP